MKQRIWCILSLVLLTVPTLSRVGLTQATNEPLLPRQTSPDNLLLNGNMDETPFYWKPPNHWVAGDWMRWWTSSMIPEYDDVRAWRPQRYDGNHAQVYFIWGGPYTAGIYQQVPVQPCTHYQFSIFGRNHSLEGADHHAKIGLDPLGRAYNTLDAPRVSELPFDIVWSPEQTFYNVWGQHTVVAESRNETISAITYVSPDPDYYPYDTFWDGGSLVEVAPPSGTILAGSSLPAPDNLIMGLSVSALALMAIVEWDTPVPASTQVMYRYVGPTHPPGATLMPHSVFLPSVTSDSLELNLHSELDTTPVLHHRVVLQDLAPGYKIEVAALSRRLDGQICVTSASDVVRVTSPDTDFVGE